MNTPTAALAWEFWRKNQRQLLVSAATVLLFILVYPRLCLVAGFNPNSPDASDEFARQFSNHLGQLSVPDVIRMLFLLFLAGGPVAVMVISLLGMIYLFTFNGLNHKAKDFQALYARLFTLPVSTSFLFWRMQFGGVAALLALWAAWNYGVSMPRFEASHVFQNGFGWVTLLVLAQAVIWSLAAWPLTQLLLLIGLMFLFLLSAGHREISGSPFVLSPLFLLGMVVARVGLEKLRHGEWRGDEWKLPFRKLAARFQFALRHWPSRFATPAQAQWWFEWSRFALGMSYVTILLAVVPLAIFVVHALAGWGPLEPEAMKGFSTFLIFMPLLLYLILGLGLGFQFSQGGTDQRFLLVRPMKSGDMVMAMLKALGIGTALTWIGVLSTLAVLPCFGDFSSVENALSPLPGFRAAVLIGLAFLTWRMAAINLCFGLTGNKWLSNAPVLVPLIFWMVVGVFHPFLDPDGRAWNWLVSHAIAILAGLLILKCLLAAAAFRACVQRGLLSPSGVARYLMVWSLLAAALLATLVLLTRPPREFLVPACLTVVLLVPLARIGFAPLAFAKSRHLE